MERIKRTAERFLPDVVDGATVEGLSFPHAAPQMDPTAVQKHQERPNMTEDASDEINAPISDKFCN